MERETSVALGRRQEEMERAGAEARPSSRQSPFHGEATQQIWAGMHSG